MEERLIVLLEGKFHNGHMFPTVLANHEVIAEMYKDGIVINGGLPPTHVMVKDHELYGHKIEYTEETVGVAYRQILRVTAVQDKQWIAQQGAD